MDEQIMRKCMNGWMGEPMKKKAGTNEMGWKLSWQPLNILCRKPGKTEVILLIDLGESKIQGEAWIRKELLGT